MVGYTISSRVKLGFMAAALGVSMLACSMGGNTTQNPSPAQNQAPTQDIGAIVQQTLEAERAKEQAEGLIQTQQSLIETQSAMLAWTDTPMPTATYTLEPTKTLEPTSTPKSADDGDSNKDVKVNVDIDTYCRKGPDKIYRDVGALVVGEESIIRGRLDDDSWFLIDNVKPYDKGTKRPCWLWSGEANVMGDLKKVPVVEIPPIEQMLHIDAWTNPATVTEGGAYQFCVKSWPAMEFDVEIDTYVTWKNGKKDNWTSGPYHIDKDGQSCWNLVNTGKAGSYYLIMYPADKDMKRSELGNATINIK